MTLYPSPKFADFSEDQEGFSRGCQPSQSFQITKESSTKIGTIINKQRNIENTSGVELPGFNQFNLEVKRMFKK